MFARRMRASLLRLLLLLLLLLLVLLLVFVGAIGVNCQGCVGGDGVRDRMEMGSMRAWMNGLFGLLDGERIADIGNYGSEQEIQGFEMGLQLCW